MGLFERQIKSRAAAGRFLAAVLFCNRAKRPRRPGGTAQGILREGGPVWHPPFGAAVKFFLCGGAEWDIIREECNCCFIRYEVTKHG